MAEDGGRVTAAAVPFDEAAWMARLRELNPWADGLEIDEENEAFTAARKAACLARPYIPPLVTALSTAHSFLAAILLFLAGLALRNMYRVK